MSANLRAFLYLIRWCEGTAKDNGYRMLFGGELFEGFAAHPNRRITKPLGSKVITSTAAGAYQFLFKTWEECRKALNLPDFSPESQDRAAVYLIQRRGALEDVEAGRLKDAIRKCALEWASLPGSPYGQPTKWYDECERVFVKAGGTLAGQAPTAPMAASGLIGTPPVPEAAYSAPLKQEPALLKIPPWPFNTQPPSEVRMAFPLAALLPSLISAAPDLIRVFGKGERSEQNARAVETVLAVAKEATGAVNEQQAVEMIEAQPEKADAFRTAIKDRWYELAEAGGGGIAAAREYGAKERGDRGPWMNPALWISAAILPLVYFVVYRVIGAEPGVFSDEIRVMVVTAVISGVLGSITGFWLGSSMSSRNKDEALMRK